MFIQTKKSAYERRIDHMVAITKLTMDIGNSLESLYRPGGAIYEAAATTLGPTPGSYRLGEAALQRLKNHQHDILVRELCSKPRLSSLQVWTLALLGQSPGGLRDAFPEATPEDVYDAACISKLSTLADESSCPGTPTAEEMCATPFDGSTQSSSSLSEKIEWLLGLKVSGCASPNTTTTCSATEKGHGKVTSTVETPKSSPHLPGSWPDVTDEVQENKSKLDDKQQLLTHSDRLRRSSNDPRPEPESIMTLIFFLLVAFLMLPLILFLLPCIFFLLVAFSMLFLIFSLFLLTFFLSLVF
ncbi:hypothetical protein NM208_g15404 [Fusarium decemcellulare]|uniref:Uncharacterized protein n=1 Tax=Fusarium decemcellulare TaxID=57161 RepID=A0ACC1RGK3_9HYPO|nr:hypothetical protein NM208_g15404 [Fusarium decemcellulare]